MLCSGAQYRNTQARCDQPGNEHASSPTRSPPQWQCMQTCSPGGNMEHFASYFHRTASGCWVLPNCHCGSWFQSSRLNTCMLFQQLKFLLLGKTHCSSDSSSSRSVRERWSLMVMPCVHGSALRYSSINGHKSCYDYWCSKRPCWPILSKSGIPDVLCWCR